MAWRSSVRPRGDQLWNVKPHRDCLLALGAIRELVAPECLGLIIGPAGSGKSFSIDVYRDKHTDTRVVEVPPRVVQSTGCLLDSIAEVLGVSPRKPNSEYAEAIATHLRDSGTYLILDEADRLTVDHADLIRSICDHAGRAICLAATPAIEVILAKHAPIAQRVGLRFPVARVGFEDLEQAFANSDFPHEVLQEAYTLGNGNLRIINVLIRQLRASNVQPTVKIARAAFRQLVCHASQEAA